MNGCLVAADTLREVLFRAPNVLFRELLEEAAAAALGVEENIPPEVPRPKLAAGPKHDVPAVDNKPDPMPPLNHEDDPVPPSNPATGGPCDCGGPLRTEAMAIALLTPGKGVGPEIDGCLLLTGCIAELSPDGNRSFVSP